MAAHQWTGHWISDATYHVEKGSSPVPMVFRRRFHTEQDAASVRIDVTAMGIFVLFLDGKRVGKDYFAPGFTDYEHTLQYMTYEMGPLATGDHAFTAVVAGGWAVGRSTNVANTDRSVSCLEADRQALLVDLTLTFADGTTQVIGTDAEYGVSEEGACRFADFYDGETYDARIPGQKISYRHAAPEKLRHHPNIVPCAETHVREYCRLKPVAVMHSPEGNPIYAFGQNIAGVVSIRLKGRAGQQIVIRHAEALQPEKTQGQLAGITSGEAQGQRATDQNKAATGRVELYTQNLRSAKQTLTYICRDGIQSFTPHLTYMGFRYAEVTGIPEEDISIEAIALTSAMQQIGDFSCSNDDLNQLQRNIQWSARDNFIEIPTDCPQRDERQGWTGDIALFVRTAVFNYDLDAFLGKWLHDMRNEQGPTGSIPFVVPRRRGVTPSMTTSCWGDSCVLVPWELYRNSGDTGILQEMYPVMKRYLADVARFAALSTVRYGSPYIFALPFQFGDWCAPYGGLKDWLARGPWVGTAYYCHTTEIMSRIAEVLGRNDDAEHYHELSVRIAKAYMKTFTDGRGRLREEFQTGYVLPLYFGMCGKAYGETEGGRIAHAMAESLWRLVRDNGMHLSTGFTATPYILFALADNGFADEAYQLLLQDTSPSWLYQIRKGATTTWEQWDVIGEDEQIKEASMNHYAYGAVGDFFYRRICGLEPLEAGYRRFSVKPLVGGGLSHASCRHRTPYGEIRVEWHLVDGELQLQVDAPDGTTWVR